MRLEGKRGILGAAGTAIACLLGIVSAGGQAPAPQKPLMAEDAFKNVQVLKGIPVDQFMETMGFFSASLGANCTTCHGEESGGSWEKYADDTDYKRTTRKMILMVEALNKNNFGGRRVVTCYSCHRGDDRPKITPSLVEVYGSPSPEDPNEIPLGQPPAGVTADQILDKYIQALGGTAQLSKLTSFAGKGSEQGYADPELHPTEVFAKVPNQRATIIHTLDGDNTTTYDGRAGWIAQPSSAAPVPVVALTGDQLEGAKIDAELSFPAQLRQDLSGWRVGSPVTIDDHAVQVVQGTASGGRPVRLFFDKESGLLVRQVRYTGSPVGLSPVQIDYADYRDVSGVKMPFHWTVTWLDGKSIFELANIQANAPIEAARFAKPAPPKPVSPAKP